MPNFGRSSRDHGLRRVNRLTGATLIGGLAITGGFSAVAAHAYSGSSKKAAPVAVDETPVDDASANTDVNVVPQGDDNHRSGDSSLESEAGAKKAKPPVPVTVPALPKSKSPNVPVSTAPSKPGAPATSPAVAVKPKATAAPTIITPAPQPRVTAAPRPTRAPRPVPPPVSGGS
jgi:hypothetical protein